MRTLAETKGRVGGENGAAALLGINRTTLLSRMKKFGIHPKQFCRIQGGPIASIRTDRNLFHRIIRQTQPTHPFSRTLLGLS